MGLNRYTLGSRVRRDGVAFEVIDFRESDDAGWRYDLKERDGDGLLDDVPEGELVEGLPPTFDVAVARARRVLCGDREGIFTCHTVDPYVDALVEARNREVMALRMEAEQLRAVLRGLRKIVGGVPCGSLDTPWVARGRCIYPSSQLTDYGDLVATFEDVDGVVPVETVCAVNAFMEVKDHLDRFFKDKKETDGGPQG